MKTEHTGNVQLPQHKPFFPVDEKWIQFLGIDLSEKFQTELTEIQIASNVLAENMYLVGYFGSFIVISFSSNYYLVPEKSVQVLIWSIQHNVDSQFTDSEILVITGLKNRQNLLNDLSKIQDKLFKQLTSSESISQTTDTSLNEKIDAFLNSTDGADEVPSYFDSHNDYWGANHESK